VKAVKSVFGCWFWIGDGYWASCRRRRFRFGGDDLLSRGEMEEESAMMDIEVHTDQNRGSRKKSIRCDLREKNSEDDDGDLSGDRHWNERHENSGDG